MMNHFGGYVSKNYPPLFRILCLGMVRQAFFFTLSGFLLFYVFSSDSVSSPKTRMRWYKKRFVRIVPVYYIALSLALVHYALFKKSQLSALDVIVGSVLRFAGLHSFFPKYVYEPGVLLASWSLSVEIVFYLIFPFIARFAWDWNRKRLVALLLVSILYSTCASPITRNLTEDRFGSSIWYANGLMYVGCFVTGCAIARLTNLKEATSPKSAWTFMGVGAILFFVDFGILFHVWLPSLLIPLIGTAFLLYGSGQLSKLPHPPKTPALLDFLGNSAYCLFLFHGPIGSICNSVFLRAGQRSIHDSPVSLTIYAIISVITSVLLYKYLELPIRARFSAGPNSTSADKPFRAGSR